MEHEVTERVLLGPREDVALMEGYHSPQIEVEVRLNTNEAPEEPPAGFVARIAEGIEAIAMNRYPNREADRLREAIAEHHGVDVSRVYCANGSNEVLQSILLAYGGQGRTVAVFEPTYALHSHIARVTATTVIAGSRNSDFLISIDEFERVAGRARELGSDNPAITFVCSPNNPTGRLEPLETVIQILERTPGLVIVDEAYGQFAPHSALELLDLYRNLLVVRTFSKTWSLAALRLGYVVADPEIIEALWRVTLPYHLDAFKQAAGVIALDYESEMDERVARIVAERGRLIDALSALPLEVCPSQANFVLFKVKNRSAEEVWQALVDQSVLIRDISGLPHLAGYLRVTVGTREENDRFLRALADVLA